MNQHKTLTPLHLSHGIFNFVLGRYSLYTYHVWIHNALHTLKIGKYLYHFYNNLSEIWFR